MASRKQITQWIGKLGEGDPSAARLLWEQYIDKLVRLAERQLKGVPQRASDGEDVALSAMYSFWRGMAAHRFDTLEDREDLWKLLVTITTRKACAHRRRHFAKKRGGNKVRGESVFIRAGSDDEADEGIGRVLGQEPTPELAAMFAEDCRRLLESLGDETLRRVALLALEGYSTAEIAEKLGCLQRTVQRRLKTIRDIWSLEVQR